MRTSSTIGRRILVRSSGVSGGVRAEGAGALSCGPGSAGSWPKTIAQPNRSAKWASSARDKREGACDIESACLVRGQAFRGRRNNENDERGQGELWRKAEVGKRK